MRWDIGKVYKEIRESKGLSQKAVAGTGISRQSLISFEKGESMPRYETMDYLLRQINMDFAEFEYICNHYQQNSRQKIYTAYLNLLHSAKTEEFQALLEKCQDYLKTNHDIPIQRFSDTIEIFMEIQTINSFSEISKPVQHITEKIWQELERQDTWYRSDLRMLNTILYFFPIETVHLMTDRILQTLEKYKDFEHIKSGQLALLTNLSTIYLYNDHMSDCSRILDLIIPIAKAEKRYDMLAFAQVRHGICNQNEALIQQGLKLLELMEEKENLETAKEEVRRFLKKS